MNFSGRTTCHPHKFGDWQNKKCDGKPCVRAIKLVDVQWSDCPVEIEEIVRKMWQSNELGNDHYVIKFKSFEDLEYGIEADEYKLLTEYFESQGIKDGDECFIHWWW